MGVVELLACDEFAPPLLRMTGEFDLSNVDLIEDVLVLWAAQGHREIVVDLARASFIDSTTIGAMVRAALGGTVVTVRNPLGRVARALEIASVGEVLNIEPPSP